MPPQSPNPHLARRPGLFGGSFDPVHRGHLAVARAAREAFDLDRVLFVPAARPPHKPGRRLAPARDRVAMLELALADEPGFEVATLELSREGPSYTIDTVRALQAGWPGLAPDASLHLVLGSDNLPGLVNWREVETLLQCVQPIVLWRAGDPPHVPVEVVEGLTPGLVQRIERGFLALPPSPGSSTELRAALGEGRHDHPDLPPGVGEYVRMRGLYTPAP